LQTLRRYFTGQVDVFVWPESRGIVEQICKDPYLNVGYIPWEPEFRGHSDTYVDKTCLIQSIEEKDEVLFLDADTTIHGKLTKLFDAINNYGFVATQFNDWVTNGRIISGRIKTLREFSEIDGSLIDLTVSKTWPSVNTGIFGAIPTSPVLKLWHKWTYAARGTFIPDEKVCHLMLPKFGPSGQMYIAEGGAWNCSPNYQPKNLADSDVIIRHYHGDCNLRPDKSKKGYELWWPIFNQALQLNSGNIRSWVGNVQNKWLKKLLNESK
jgi:hypothetical protein